MVATESIRIRPSFLKRCGIFEGHCDTPAQRNRIGLEQFHAFESHGVRPLAPDPYFLRLLHGKGNYEFSITDMAACYSNGEWPGWNYLKWEARWDEPRLREVAKRLGRDWESIDFGSDQAPATRKTEPDVATAPSVGLFRRIVDRIKQLFKW